MAQMTGWSKIIMKNNACYSRWSLIFFPDMFFCAIHAGFYGGMTLNDALKKGVRRIKI